MRRIRTKAVQNRPARLHQPIRHAKIIGARHIARRKIATVVLQIVRAHLRISHRINVFVTKTPRLFANWIDAHADATGTGIRAVIGVDAQFEPLGMHIIGKPLDTVRKFSRNGIRLYDAVRIARTRPAVVNVHELITGRLHAVRNHRVGGVRNRGLADAAAIAVPVVPAHLRREREIIGYRQERLP